MNLRYFSFSGLSVLAVVAAFSCKPPKENRCDKFKAGDFEYHSNGLLYSITREEAVQTEVNELNGDITKNSITWTDDCRYQLKILESTAIYTDSINKLRMASTLTVEILSSTDSYYVYRSKSDVTDHVVVDTLWIK